MHIQADKRTLIQGILRNTDKLSIIHSNGDIEIKSEKKPLEQQP